MPTHAPTSKLFPRPGYEHSEAYAAGYAHGYDDDDATDDLGPLPLSAEDLGIMDGAIQGAHDRGGCMMAGQAMTGYVDIFHAGMSSPED